MNPPPTPFFNTTVVVLLWPLPSLLLVKGKWWLLTSKAFQNEAFPKHVCSPKNSVPCVSEAGSITMTGGDLDLDP